MERENNEKERNTEQENDKPRIGGGRSFFKEGGRVRVREKGELLEGYNGPVLEGTKVDSDLPLGGGYDCQPSMNFAKEHGTGSGPWG